MTKLQLYPFQEETVDRLLNPSPENSTHFVVAPVGTGKTAVMFNWLERRQQYLNNPAKINWLIVTTPAKVKSGDFFTDLERFTDYTKEAILAHHGSFKVISWYQLDKLVKSNDIDFSGLLVAFDEVHKGSGMNLSGASSMSKAFVKIASHASDFIGLTATPGDTWSKFCAYFVATNLIKTKTQYYNHFAVTQDFKGFREIAAWRDEETLKSWWGRISYAPDTSEVINQLPSEMHEQVFFKKPTGYDKVLKTRVASDGTLLDTPGKLIAELRRIASSKDKLEWLGDFIENADSGIVIFVNLIAEEEAVYEVAKKALKNRGDNAPIFRIDGSHKEFPTEETIKNGVVICHYLSGGEALNLQFMHLWVSLSPNYSYSTSVQARGRVQRIGQKHPVSYYYLTSKGTIDEDIYKILKTKKDFKEENWVI